MGVPVNVRYCILMTTRTPSVQDVQYSTARVLLLHTLEGVVGESVSLILLGYLKAEQYVQAEDSGRFETLPDIAKPRIDDPVNSKRLLNDRIVR